MTTMRSWARTSGSAVGTAVRVFLRDTGHGFLEVCHNSLALVGLIVLGAALFVAGRADLRSGMEVQLLGWLQERQEARLGGADAVASAATAEPAAIARATAADPAELDRRQAFVAHWLAKRYHVAPEPVSRLVKEAWDVGRQANLDPTLILAIMAIESSFNPFAQSTVGAQGLMQVMTQVHDDKYEAFGGQFAAFDPVTNLRVGVQVLKECIAKAGSLEGGLRFYVGAANLSDDGGYAHKVLAERDFLRRVAEGQQVSVLARAPAYVAPAAAAASSAQADEARPAEPTTVAMLH